MDLSFLHTRNQRGAEIIAQPCKPGNNTGMRDEDGLEMLLAVRRRVRKWREYRGLNIYQLSELSGISHTTIYRLEEGHHADIQLSTLHSLARALQVPLSRLLTGF